MEEPGGAGLKENFSFFDETIDLIPPLYNWEGSITLWEKICFLKFQVSGSGRGGNERKGPVLIELLS